MLTCKIITTEAEAYGLAEDRDRLHELPGRNQIASFAFFRAWWKTVRRGDAERRGLQKARVGWDEHKKAFDSAKTVINRLQAAYLSRHTTMLGKQMRKTIFKTISYAIMHMSIAILIAYILSGSWKVALAIGLLEQCFQTVGFFFHERRWHRLENKQSRPHYHDSVIDSVSPASPIIEDMLNRKG